MNAYRHSDEFVASSLAMSPSRPARVLLTGTYNSHNKGDAAMQIATARQLAMHLPGRVDVELYSPFPALDTSFYAPMPVRFDDRRRLIRGTAGLAAGTIKREFAAADLVVDLSGDMLTEDYGPHVAWSHFLPLMRARAAGTPYVICAQSIGPFKHTLPIAKRVLQGARAITVRDPISLDYLTGIGIDRARLRQTADMAFLLPAADEQVSHQLVRSAGLDPARPIVAISLSRLIAARHDRIHGPGSFTAMMASELAQLAERFAVQLLLVAHVTGPSEAKDDRIISREVAALLARADVKVLDADLRPEELKGVIGRCRATIGCRMHANIASLSSGVPVLALAYSHKTPGIMRACGLEDMAIDVDHFDRAEFGAKAALLLERRDNFAARLAANLPVQIAAAETNIDLIADILAGDA